jgi:hypothetical protein
MGDVERRPKYARFVSSAISAARPCATNPAAIARTTDAPQSQTTRRSIGRVSIGTRAASSEGPSAGATGRPCVVDERSTS